MGFGLVAQYTQRFFAGGPAAARMSVCGLKMAVQSLAPWFLTL
jgi:hypothetical protein